MNEPAGHIFNRRMDDIKKSIKSRIAIYDPLDFNTTYKNFIKRLPSEDFNMTEEALDSSIKNFLIESAYFALEKKYILYRFMKTLNFSNPNDIKLLEIVEFVTKQIETDDLKRLKKFEEKCKFKTFFSTVVTRLLNDFWRDRFKTEKKVEKYKPELLDLFDKPQPSPLETILDGDSEEMKKKAGELLPHALNTLDYNEKLAIRLKYEEDLNVGEIARTFANSRYKTAQFIKQIEHKISMEIQSMINKGGYNETPGR